MELDQRKEGERTRGKGKEKQVGRGMAGEKAFAKKVIKGIGKPGKKAEKDSKRIEAYHPKLAYQGRAQKGQEHRQKLPHREPFPQDQGRKEDDPSRRGVKEDAGQGRTAPGDGKLIRGVKEGDPHKAKRYVEEEIPGPQGKSPFPERLDGEGKPGEDGPKKGNLQGGKALLKSYPGDGTDQAPKSGCPEDRKVAHALGL